MRRIILIILILIGIGIIGYKIWFYSSKLACETRDGLWGRISLLPFSEWICTLPTSDAGKECTNSEQCEGYCLAEGLDSKIGYCQKYITRGCFYIFNSTKEGKVGRICWD